jgi:hypothetical protein
MKWFNRNDFKSGTVHHVYTDYGENNIEYFKSIKK